MANIKNENVKEEFYDYLGNVKERDPKTVQVYDILNEKRCNSLYIPLQTNIKTDEEPLQNECKMQEIQAINYITTQEKLEKDLLTSTANINHAKTSLQTNIIQLNLF